jgi:membrane protease YdiL (CAAX protease family)
MNTDHLTAPNWLERIILALVFLIVGGAIIVVFTPWGKPVLGDSVNYIARLILSALLLVAFWLVHRSPRLEKYAQIVFALFILLLALSLDWVFGSFLFDTLHMNDSLPSGWAFPKLNDCLVIVSVVVVFTLLSRRSLGSIYLQKGNLKLGLLIGGIAFIIAAAGSIPMASLLFGGHDLTIARAIPWMPWILAIVLANAALEEILFRGLFLRKLEPFFGKFISNLLIALVFTALHKGASYTSDQLIFLVILIPLALAWGYITQKTDSVWGSILFHAGTDIPIFLGIFSNL